MNPPGSEVGKFDRVCDLCGSIVDRVVIARHRGKKKCGAIKEVQALLDDGWRPVNHSMAGRLVTYAKVPKKKAPLPIFNKRGRDIRDGSVIGTWVPQWVTLIIGLACKERPIGYYHDAKDRLTKAKGNLEYRNAQVALAVCVEDLA